MSVVDDLMAARERVLLEIQEGVGYDPADGDTADHLPEYVEALEAKVAALQYYHDVLAATRGASR